MLATIGILVSSAVPMAGLPRELTVDIVADVGEHPTTACIVTNDVVVLSTKPLTLEDLREKGVLSRTEDGNTWTYELAGSPAPWLTQDFGAMPVPHQTVHEAFVSLGRSATQPDCLERGPEQCKPQLRISGPKDEIGEFAVVCTDTGQPDKVAFVRVDLHPIDEGRQPRVISSLLTPSALVVRFDTAVTRSPEADRIESTVSIVGGHFARSAAVTTIQRRARLAPAPRCARRFFRLPPAVDAQGETQSMTTRYSQSGAAPHTCTLLPSSIAADRTFAAVLPDLDISASARFDVTWSRDGSGETSATAATTWRGRTERDARDLVPGTVSFEWQWPCGGSWAQAAARGVQPECPTARSPGRVCRAARAPSNTGCRYTCELESPTSAATWPAKVRISEPRLRLAWDYEISEFNQSVEAPVSPLDRMVVVDSDDVGFPYAEVDGAVLLESKRRVRLSSRPAPVPLPGGECSDSVEYQLTGSRRFRPQTASLSWPVVTLEPARKAARVGYVGFRAGGLFEKPVKRGWLDTHALFEVGGEMGIRPVPKKRRASAVIDVAIRAFAMFGRKDYQPVTEPGSDPVSRSRWNARIGAVLRFSAGLPIKTSRGWIWFFSGFSAGGGSGRPLDRRDAAGRIPVTAFAMLNAYELQLQIRWFRATLDLLRFIGPDATHRYRLGADGSVIRDVRKEWSWIPGLTLGASL